MVGRTPAIELTSGVRGGVTRLRRLGSWLSRGPPVGAAIGVGTIHRIPIGPHIRPAGPRQFPGVLEGTETLTCPAHC
jgi:hypothetical protein